MICRDISLRITAIRETFEEIGVLVCKTKEQLSDKNSLFAEINQDFDVSFWQNEVCFIVFPNVIIRDDSIKTHSSIILCSNFRFPKIRLNF